MIVAVEIVDVLLDEEELHETPMQNHISKYVPYVSYCQ